MGVDEIIAKLNKNINDLTVAQADSGMLKVTIFQKELDQLKEQKLAYLNKMIQKELVTHDQKDFDFKDEINKVREEYMFQIEKLENVYAKLYIDVYKILENAIENQNLAIANIVSLEQRMNENNYSENELKGMKIIQRANVQKKQNYNVMIKECRARLDWCHAEVIKEINRIFEEKKEQVELVEVKYNIIQKIIRSITNTIHGRNRFINFLNRFEDETLVSLKSQVDEKVYEVSATITGVIKQMKKCKQKISEIYERQVNFNRQTTESSV